MYDKMKGTRQLHEAMVGSEAESYNLGQEGEILDVPLAALDLCTHGLTSGPPCPPWASSGAKRGAEDPRAAVFQRLLASQAETGVGSEACGETSVSRFRLPSQHRS